MDKAKECLLSMISFMVDNPNAVEIASTRDDMGVLLSLKVSKEDIGKVIGKQGNTAKALRTILRTIGMKEKARINLKIEEPEGSTHQPYQSPSDSTAGGDSTGQYNV